MDPFAFFGACVGACVTVAGATWALRTKLSDIEVAIKGHVAEDKAIQSNQEARIIKLEGRRKR